MALAVFWLVGLLVGWFFFCTAGKISDLAASVPEMIL